MAEDPGPGVLADVLAMAAERGRLVDADRILQDVLGPAPVLAGHRVWTARLREGFLRRDDIRRVLPEKSGTRADTSDAAFALVRRLPDPSQGGRAGRARR